MVARIVCTKLPATAPPNPPTRSLQPRLWPQRHRLQPLPRREMVARRQRVAAAAKLHGVRRRHHDADERVHVGGQLLRCGPCFRWGRWHPACRQGGLSAWAQFSQLVWSATRQVARIMKRALRFPHPPKQC